MDHYDLLARPDWKAQFVFIVTPYVEAQFFKRLVKDLKPKLLTVVIDDGCRPEDVSMLKAAAKKHTAVRVALGGATGLVHAKIFYVEWETPGGKRAHSFIYGSGNATRQAFHGGINAELMCKARITSTNHKPILDWIRAAHDAVSRSDDADVTVEAARDVWLADGVSVRLPPIKVKAATAKASNFDLWLQRGLLGATYRPDANFLRVQINLLKELPPGTLEQTIQQVGFETLRTKRLSIPYLEGAEGIDEGSDGSSKWRGRYFAQTQLGDWCSAECYRSRGQIFQKGGHEAREHLLLRLKAMQNALAREQTRDRYLARIESLWAALGEEAGHYLSATSSGVNLGLYATTFDQRVEHDLSLSANEEFRQRFIDGLEIIDVPRFRVDAAAWNSFVESFARQLQQESLKRKSVSLIYHRVASALYELVDNPFDDPDSLVKTLRKHWNTEISGADGERTTVGGYIDSYHEVG
ncbi:hypothetical protein ACSV5G_00115 [Agrobacterium cavarae]|uniref:hypothetical protein n=1 Tax=Agrobacterium cavarae TaxID=2528239 RepID=UPI003FCF04A6